MTEQNWYQFLPDFDEYIFEVLLYSPHRTLTETRHAQGPMKGLLEKVHGLRRNFTWNVPKARTYTQGIGYPC